MVRSMTAFARCETDESWGGLIWEVRSVNHRYLEPSIRLPETLRALETDLRERLRHRLARGKVECSLKIQLRQDEQDLNINSALVKQIGKAMKELESDIQHLAPVDSLELLRWPGVLQEQEADMDRIKQDTLNSFDRAIDKLLEGREREGEELKKLIIQRLDGVTDIITQVRPLIPQSLESHKQRMLSRLEEIKAELDISRLEQEMAYLAQKIDVAEELDRLQAHVSEVHRTLEQNQPKGRRLDFLMQELNREANTLSSKSTLSHVSQSAVELKVLIEQMREQIQNIE